jgi:hypothetical protein
MSKFGHLTLSMVESLRVKEVKLNGEVVTNVVELNDKEGWLRRYSAEYVETDKEMKIELLKGDVEIVWDE